MAENEQNQQANKESKRLVKTKQRERLVRKARMRRERIRGFFGFLLTLGLLFVLFQVAKLPGWYMDESAFSRVDGNTVKIINNHIVPSYKILALLKDNEVPKLPVYLMKTTELKRQIKELPPIENVYIRRYAFPARLQIIVRERIPVITISPEAKVAPVAFFTQDGKLIGREYMPLSKDFKTTLVLSYGNKGDDYRKWDMAKINQIQKIVKYIETYAEESVEYIDYRNPKDIYVKVQTTNIRIGVPDDTVYERIMRIPSILPQVKLMDAKVKYIDLSWEKVNYLKLN